MKRLMTLLLLLAACFSLEAKKHKKYQYEVSITAIFRDEARWIKEWIEYHRLIGVEHFYLYNNLSKDHYKQVLQPYIDSGVVTLTEWPEQSTSVDHWTKIQTSAYSDALKKSKGVSKWLAILDLDEFVVPVTEDNLARFLSAYERHPGLVVHWQMFGTSHVERVPDDKLMVETLTWKAADNYGENAFIKTIVRPEYVQAIKDPHKAIFKPGYHPVNAKRERVGKNSTNHLYDLEYIRINHYWSRDNEYFHTKKRPRREGWLEGFDGQLARLNNLHHHEDHFILRFVPELRKRMGLE